MPADVRRRLGIRAGGLVILEERAGAIVLRPLAMLEVDVYSGKELARWKSEDRLDAATRSRILKKLGRKRPG